jgi:hypothetical protein
MNGNLFQLGNVVATPAALDALNMRQMVALLSRHRTGDWGDLCDEDRAANDEAVAGEGRILSAYTVGDVKLWVITEWDRSVTTLLLPEEY